MVQNEATDHAELIYGATRAWVPGRGGGSSASARTAIPSKSYELVGVPSPQPHYLQDF